jgi:hypothetical protein
LAAHFDTRVIFSSFHGQGAPRESSQPEAEALSVALDFLAEVASGVPWRDAIEGILEMLSHAPNTLGCLPVALLDCRVASIRSYKYNELPHGLLAAFDAAIALLISGQTSYSDAQVCALIAPIIEHPEHPPLEGLQALLVHLEPRFAEDKVTPAVRDSLADLRSKFAGIETEGAFQELKQQLETLLEPKTRRNTLNIKISARKKPRQVRTEPPRPSEKWLRNVESLLETMGEDRVRIMAKRAFCSFMSERAPEATEALLGYAWISERLCDDELIEILAEVARRCLDPSASNETFDLGMASARALARQSCEHSIEWLQWLLDEIEDAEIAEEVSQLYAHRLKVAAV